MLILGVPVYFNALTVACLLPVLIALASGIYLLTLKRKTCNTWLFVSVTFLLALFDFGYAAASAVHAPYGAFHRWITVFAVLPVMACLYLFLQSFSDGKIGVVQLRIFFLEIGISLLTLVFFIHQSLTAPRVFRLSGQFWDFEMPHESLVVAGLILIYVCITFGNSLARYNTMQNRQNARTFLYLVLASNLYLLPSAVFNPLARKGIVSFEFFLWVQAIGTTSIFLVVYLIFLSHTQERTTLAGNMIGVTLVLVTTCIPLLGYPLIEERKASFRDLWAKRLIAGGIPARDSSMVFLVPVSPESSMASKYFRDNESYYVKILAATQPTDVILRADGLSGIYIFRVEWPETAQDSGHSGSTLDPQTRTCMIGIELLELRRYIHPTATKLVLAQIIVILVIVGLFPVFIRGILLAPMQRLLDGVIAVSRGNYGYRIESRRSDELGVISRHFDQMAVTIEAATTHLEKTVSDRTAQLSAEKKKSDQLLLNILPKQIAEELKETGRARPVRVDSATVLFTDFVGFTKVSETLNPEQIVDELDKCFSYFDQVVDKYRLEKLKTIGDSYMCAGGVPTPNQTHAIDCCLAALEIQNFMNQMKEIKAQQGYPYWELRLGIHSGPLVAGVVGNKKFAYDIWGDTVNTASRLESSGTPGRINVSAATLASVTDFFETEPRGKVAAKGKGSIEMYYLLRIRARFASDPDGRVPNEEFLSLYKQLLRKRISR